MEEISNTNIEFELQLHRNLGIRKGVQHIHKAKVECKRQAQTRLDL
ncbi:hypothetical protein BVRB_3g060350 [Beta vulgaris subsp. vulgaris]|nr:hypothetical protein BVRB_3g060350 [Beta vulgaris subsp. vulgaris]